jgi:hypothetical protein
MRYERRHAIDSRIDTDTGEFEMVMATEGEASDGHIISIAGLEFPDAFPLHVDHARSTVGNVGNVQNIRRDTIDGEPVYRGVGRIRLTGDGEALAARRDLVDAISTGDIRGTSLTWDASKAVERRSLPTKHRAHVARGEKDPRKRYGLYFESSVGVEQSIVAIGADKGALIGRAEAAPDALTRALWQTMADRIDDAPRSRETEIIDALEATVESLQQRVREAGTTTPSDEDPETLPTLDVCLDEAARQIGEAHRLRGTQLDDALAELFLRVTGHAYNGR